MQRVNGQEVSGEFDETLALLLSLLLLDGLFQFGLAMLCHLGTLALLQQLDLVATLIVAGVDLVVRLKVIVKQQEELARCHYDLAILVKTASLSNDVDSFFVGPDATLIQLYHEREGAFRSRLIHVLQHGENEIL